MKVKISFFQGMQIVSYLKGAISKVVKDKEVTFDDAIEIITSVFLMLGINVMNQEHQYWRN